MTLVSRREVPIKLWQLLPTVVIISPLLVTVGLLWLWIRLAGRSGKRNPLAQELLRSPGESLREQLEDNSWDLATYFGMSPFPIVSAYSIYISQLAFEGRTPGIAFMVLLGAVVLYGQGWFLYKIWSLLKKRRLLRLGYEAELAVGQELNELGRSGFYLFHDVPAKNFNVDHVAVGANGVFAIETKGRAKPISSSDRKTWEVDYDGKKLQFPGWQETEPLEQAQRQAKWLRDWLSKAVGESVSVRPVLILPGWYIRRTSGEGIAVINATNVQKFFPKYASDVRLSRQLIERIAHQLDQRCRNVEARAYKSEEKR